MARFTNLPSSKEAWARSGHELGDWGSLGMDASQDVLSALIPGLNIAKGAHYLKRGLKTGTDVLKATKAGEKLTKGGGTLLELAENTPVVDAALGTAKIAGNVAADVAKNKPLGLSRRANYWLQGQALAPVDNALEVLKLKQPMSLTNYFKKNNIWPRNMKDALKNVDKKLSENMNKRADFMKRMNSKKGDEVLVGYDKTAEQFHKKGRAPNVNKQLLEKMKKLYLKQVVDFTSKKFKKLGISYPTISNMNDFKTADEVLTSLGQFMSKEKNRAVIGSDEGRAFIKAMYSDIRDAQRRYLKSAGGRKAVKEFNDITNELDLLINSKEPLISLTLSGRSTNSLENINRLAGSAQMGMKFNYYTLPAPRLGQDALLNAAKNIKKYSPLVEPVGKQLIQYQKGKEPPKDYVTKRNKKETKIQDEYDTYNWE